MGDDISVRDLQERPAVHAADRIAREDLGDGLQRLVKRVLDFAEVRGISPSGPPFARFLRWGGEVLEVEVGIPVASSERGGDGIVASKLQGGLTAVKVHAGRYEELREVYLHMANWVTEEGYVQNGHPWQIFWTDPWADDDTPTSGTTEVFWPIRRPKL